MVLQCATYDGLAVNKKNRKSQLALIIFLYYFYLAKYTIIFVIFKYEFILNTAHATVVFP